MILPSSAAVASLSNGSNFQIWCAFGIVDARDVNPMRSHGSEVWQCDQRWQRIGGERRRQVLEFDMNGRGRRMGERVRV